MSTPISDELASYGYIKPELIKTIRLKEEASELTMAEAEPILEQCRELVLQNEELIQQDIEETAKKINTLAEKINSEKKVLLHTIELLESKEVENETSDLLNNFNNN
ncbi:MAG: hypothetical protein ACK4NC_03060 [Candidatus Gracilibacteria bacterium]